MIERSGASLPRAARRMGCAIFRRTGPRGGRVLGRSTLAVGALALAIGAAGGVALAGSADGAAAAASVPADERARIEAVVRAYILANPEIIPEAMERLQEKRSANAVAENREALVTPYSGAWEGAADGDVVLVEFFDYACGYCRTSLADVDRLLAEDKRLKVVYRELPILSEDSERAARVGLLAARQGKYPAFHRAMYAAGGVDAAAIRKAAASAGLDRAAVDQAIQSTEPAAELANNIQLARVLEARGTPLFVVGDQILNGAVGYEALKAAVAKARSAKPAG